MTRTSISTHIDLELLMPARPKVFGIGFHKTATSSLASALYRLGYLVDGYFNVEEIPSRQPIEQYAVERARRVDAVQDMPWPVLYPALDAAFPGSKFVLTVRDPERWIKSVVTHFGDVEIPSHTAIYGVPEAASHRDIYLERYLRHEREVRAYFADRPDDLLVIDIGQADDLNELCSFMGVATVPGAFPSHNSVGDRERGRYARAARRRVEGAARAAGFRWGPQVGAYDAYVMIHRVERHIESLCVLHEELGSGAAREGLGRVLSAHSRELNGLLDVAGASSVASDNGRSAGGVADESRKVRFRLRCWGSDLTHDSMRAQLDRASMQQWEVVAEVTRSGVSAARQAATTLLDHSILVSSSYTLPTA